METPCPYCGGSMLKVNDEFGQWGWLCFVCDAWILVEGAKILSFKDAKSKQVS